jgi:hypothetical protein
LPTDPANYVLQWSGTFDGSTPDNSRWNFRFDTKVNHGLTSTQLSSNIRMDGSNHINIALLKQSIGDSKYIGGGGVSRACLRYGCYEAQSKTTANPGWHASFCMFAGNGATTCVPTSDTEKRTQDLVNIWLTSVGYGSDIPVSNNPSPASLGPVAFYVRDYYTRGLLPALGTLRLPTHGGGRSIKVRGHGGGRIVTECI